MIDVPLTDGVGVVHFVVHDKEDPTFEQLLERYYACISVLRRGG